MPQLEVYCTVCNCHYWAEGEHCTAEKILITTDRIGQLYPESLDAADTATVARQHGASEADACMETCCKTFRVRTNRRPAGTPQKMEGKARELAARH